MTIGIVCYPTFGGSGVVATELGKQLALLGNEIHFISYQQPVRLDAFYPNIYYHEVNAYNYALFEGAPPYESTLASKLVDVILNHNIDILHVHYAIPHAAVAYFVKKILARKGKQIPVITTLHGTDITLIGKDKSFAPVVEFSINESDAVTVVSEYLKQETYKNFDIQKDIQVIYNFIDCHKAIQSNTHECAKMLLNQNERVITHVSNFRPIKRIADIVKGFALIREKIPSKLLLVGDGPDRQEIENLVRDLNLQSAVLFLGKQENISLIYALSDVFIMASEYESFGLAALEAMAAGVPVVTTKTGGLPELNIDGETGFTFELGDINTMANKTLEILSQPALFKTMQQNALKRAKIFDTTTIIPQYINIYNQLLSNR